MADDDDLEGNAGNGAGVSGTAVVAGLFAVSCALWIVVIIVALAAALPLTQLIIGILYKDDCPINDSIPLYLIVAGATGLFSAVLTLFQTCCKEAKLCFGCINLIVGFFQLGWFITGNVWVFRAKSTVQFDNPSAKTTYCDQTAFNGAFITIIIIYVFMIIACCRACCKKASE